MFASFTFLVCSSNCSTCANLHREEAKTRHEDFLGKNSAFHQAHFLPDTHIPSLLLFSSLHRLPSLLLSINTLLSFPNFVHRHPSFLFSLFPSMETLLTFLTSVSILPFLHLFFLYPPSFTPFFNVPSLHPFHSFFHLYFLTSTIPSLFIPLISTLSYTFLSLFTLSSHITSYYVLLCHFSPHPPHILCPSLFSCCCSFEIQK